MDPHSAWGATVVFGIPIYDAGVLVCSVAAVAPAPCLSGLGCSIVVLMDFFEAELGGVCD